MIDNSSKVPNRLGRRSSNLPTRMTLPASNVRDTVIFYVSTYLSAEILDEVYKAGLSNLTSVCRRLNYTLDR